MRVEVAWFATCVRPLCAQEAKGECSEQHDRVCKLTRIGIGETYDMVRMRRQACCKTFAGASTSSCRAAAAVPERPASAAARRLHCEL